MTLNLCIYVYLKTKLNISQDKHSSQVVTHEFVFAHETGTFGALKLPSKFGVSQCIFEYVYFARPDSIVFGDHVTKVRRDHGRQLAREHPVPTVADGEPVPVVVPVPDSAAHATIGFVEECVRLGFPCIQDLGFFRNPYVGRSFIAPSQVCVCVCILCLFGGVVWVKRDGR